jgi:signal transduction histidine kinase
LKITEVIVLQQAIYAAFVLLSLITVGDWLRHRERTRATIALALGVLAVVVLAYDADSLTGNRFAIFNILVLALFPWSGYALLLLRDRFVPLSARTKALATVVVALVSMAGLYFGAVTDQNGQRLPLTEVRFAVYRAVWLLLWVGCVGEPIVRFWLESRGRAAVQRARLRALSLGYGLVVLILGFSYATQAEASNPGVQLVIQLASLLVVPSLYASLAPPQWLRRIWRESEEERFRAAINDLLLFAPGRRALAERGIDWATRLVGAESGLVVDGNGESLAVHGIDQESAANIAADAARGGTESEIQGSTISVPLHLDNGTGRLIVIAGTYTPVFGTDEVARLQQYGAAMAAALDRVRVAERIAALEEVKSRFLRLASHELRGPLAVVRGYVSMIDDGSLQGEDLKRAVPVVLAKLGQMTGMLNEMLETSRLEDDRLELKTEKFDLRDAVSDVIDMIQPISDGHLLQAIVPNQEIPVVADRAKIETILSNLVDNAIKYSPGGGEVRLELTTRDGFAMLTVSDQGFGIAREDMKILFTRFGRIANDRTIPIPGTGLGLYLSRELARVQAGEVTAESEPGQGSKFTLSLPLAQP